MADETKLDFEGALEQLEGLVAQLEEGDLTLEGSLQTFEQGVRLVRECSERLQAAELRIRQLEEGSQRPVEVSEDD